MPLTALRRSASYLAVLAVTCMGVLAQTQPKAQQPGQKNEKANAYYYAAVAHLYEELAQTYGGRGEYLTKALENYRNALRADPDSTFLAEQLADLYLQSGQYRSAVSEFEDLVKRNPSDVNSRRILARIYTARLREGQQNRLNEEMLQRAVEQYQKIGELAPKDAANWVMLGRLQKLSQNSTDAEKSYKKALETDPSNTEAMTGLAMVYSDLGDNRSAAEMLKKVTDKSPNLNTLTSLAATYEQMKEYDLAAQTYARAVELNPNNPDLKRAWAQSLFTAEKFGEAKKIFEELVAAEPGDGGSLLRLSQIARQNQDFAQAREYARKAKQADPNNLEIRYNEVGLLEAEGKTPEAIAALKEILDGTGKRPESTGERSNRIILLERLGYLYRSNEQFDLAVATFREIQELDPDVSGRASAQIVDVLRAAKQYSEAEKEAAAALKKHPEDRMVKVMYANVLADLGRHPEAISTLKTLLDGKTDRETWLTIAQVQEKAKDYGGMEKSVLEAEKLSKSDEEKEAIYFMRGAMLEKQKKFEQSEAEFRKVLAMNPESASALNYLGYMLVDRNVRVQEGLEMIKKALAQDPHNSAFLDSLGWAYYRLNRLDEAEDQLRRSIARGSRDATVYDHLGDVYLGQGRVKDALQQWELALKEWQASAPSDVDPAEVAKIQKKVDAGKVRLARESGNQPKQ